MLAQRGSSASYWNLTARRSACHIPPTRRLQSDEMADLTAHFAVRANSGFLLSARHSHSLLPSPAGAPRVLGRTDSGHQTWGDAHPRVKASAIPRTVGMAQPVRPAGPGSCLSTTAPFVGVSSKLWFPIWNPSMALSKNSCRDFFHPMKQLAACYCLLFPKENERFRWIYPITTQRYYACD